RDAWLVDEYVRSLEQNLVSAQPETERATVSDEAELPVSRQTSDALALFWSSAFPFDSISDDVQLAYDDEAASRSEPIHEAAFAQWQARHDQLNRVGQPLRVSDREGDHGRFWPMLMLVGA